LCAQSRPTGTGYVTAAFSGTTLYAYAQTQLSGMQIPPGTKIIHTVTAGFSLGVKGGSLKPFAQSASAGPQNSQEVEEDGDIPDDGDVVYIVVAGDTAGCNYFGTIWSDTGTTSYELLPAITSLQGSAGSAFTPHVDTPQSAGQTLVIKGANLTAAGQSNPPQICVNGVCSAGGAISATGFHLGGSWNVSDSSITIPYWVDATATAGNYSLQLITAGGAATATFSVTDATPVITGVSPSTLAVGVQTTVTITGSHFGTNTPKVSLSLPNNGVAVLGGNSDSQIQVSVMAAAPGTGTLSVTAEGYGGQGFLGSPGGGQTASAQVTGVGISLSIQQGPIPVSTGDTSDSFGVSANPSNITYTPAISASLASNPNSSCQAGLNFPNTPSGQGTLYVPVTATGGANSCSGIFNVIAAAGGPTASTQIVVPPQIMIQTEVGEAGAQTQPGDETMISLLLTAKNRFGDSTFPGGSASTWQAVLVPSRYYGASNATTNGVEPELKNAAAVFAGETTESILNCEAYWSPTNPQFATLQTWTNKQANSITDTSWPSLVGGPYLWLGTPKQAVIKASILNNAQAASNLAPAIVLFRPAPSPTAPAVISIP